MKTRIALAFASVALMSIPALAQTSNVPPTRESPSQTTPSATQTQLKPGQWLATKLVGLDVYNSQKDKIGDIDQMIVNKDGAIDSVVVAAGGFLGMGQHDVAVPFKDIRWSERTISNTSGTANPPSTANDETHRGYPDHAVLDMTKDQLKRLPQVNY
jgi:hypothetical protein